MWTGRKQPTLAISLVALAIIAITLIGAATEKAHCEAKGGKRLRGAWPWENFKCYDTSSLKELP